MAEKTPQQIDAMEAEVREYRANEARQQRAAVRDAAKPLTDLVASPEFAAVLAALPTLKRISLSDTPGMPDLRNFIAAAEAALKASCRPRPPCRPMSRRRDPSPCIGAG